MTIYLGSTPCDEECASVGDDHYGFDSRIEIAAYIAQLQRTFHFHSEDAAVSFRKKRDSHDYGSYYEVVAAPMGSQRAYTAADTIEWQTPAEWDLPAIQEIVLQTAQQFFAGDELSSTGHLAWMLTPIESVPHGRRILGLIRKLRDGRTVTSSEIAASIASDPQELPAAGAGVQRFFVLLGSKSDHFDSIEFECEAPSFEQAKEQAAAQHPEYEALMHFNLV